MAEGNQANQEIAVANPADARHHADVVDDGADAVRAVRSASYDVVLMDIHMPVRDGVAAAKEIRRLPGAISKIPIIARTVNAMVGKREGYIASGMDNHASKPFDVHGPLATIRDCIGNRSADAGPGASPPTAERPASALEREGESDAVAERSMA